MHLWRPYIPWIKTYDLWNYLSLNQEYTKSADEQWITLSKYLEDDGKLLPEYLTVYNQKKSMYNEWMAITEESGYYAEQVYKTAFEKAGYKVEQGKHFPITDEYQDHIQIDLLCRNTDLNLELGVQVKNTVGEVFHNPFMFKKKSRIYYQLQKQFTYCFNKGIIPILIAPFINRSFYGFSNRYLGLHCQTYLQIIDPKYSKIADNIHNSLHFGSIRATQTAPKKVEQWVSKIPDIWNTAYI